MVTPPVEPATAIPMLETPSPRGRAPALAAVTFRNWISVALARLRAMTAMGAELAIVVVFVAARDHPEAAS